MAKVFAGILIVAILVIIGAYIIEVIQDIRRNSRRY